MPIVDPAAFSARCGHCHADSRIDPEIRERARRYVLEIAQQKNRVEIAHRQQQHYDGAGGFLGLFGGAPKTAAPIHATTTAPCASCGGAVVFRIGEASARCPHCGANAIATAHVAAQLVAVVEAHAVIAESATARAERDVLRRALVLDRGRSPTKFLGGILLGGLSFAGFGVMDVLTGDEGEIGGAIVLFGFGAIGIIGPIVAWFVLTKRPRAILRELQTIAAKMNARLENRSLFPVFDWLDATWIGENPDLVQMAEPGGRCWVMCGTWHGAPALVAITHSSDERIDLMIARRNHSAPPSSEARAFLERAGFRVKAGPGGAHALRRASDPSVLANGGVERLLEALWSS